MTTSSSTSTGTTGTGGTGGQPPDLPCNHGWDGWLAWDDFGPFQSACWAPDPANQAPPIQWEACDAQFGMAQGCRQMKIDWPHGNSSMAATVSATLDIEGKPLLELQRNSLVDPNPYRMWLVAEADGVARMAMIDVRKELKDWVIFESQSGQGVAQGSYAARVFNAFGMGEEDEAVIGGQNGVVRPELLHVYSPGSGPGLSVSRSYWGTWDSAKIQIASWGQPPETVFTGGYQQTKLVMYEDLATWQNGDLVHSSIMAWTKERGAYPFIDFGGDTTQGAHGLGTDGVDMVWVQSEGKIAGLDYYPIRQIMTAAYTKDPAELVAVRLRSYPSSSSVIWPWAVGCGYAAYGYQTGHILVVRLSDGYWWELPSDNCTPPNVTGDYCLEHALLVTCEELFVYSSGPENIERIDLASLGDPQPPD